MDTADDGVGWTPATPTPRLPSPRTIIVKLTDNTNWASQPLIIWQWNCRGLRKKKNLLLNHMTFTDTQPDILVIQEAGGALNLRGYDMFAQPSITHRRRGTADESTTPTMTLTYVRKDLPTTQEDTTHVNTPTQEHVTTTTLIGDHRLTIINTYTGLLTKPQRPSRRYKPSSLSQMLATLFSFLEILTALIPPGAMTARCR
ncbi:unnamed protein product [Ixodes persulcatus]